MVKFPLELPFQVDSSPATYSVACPVLLFGFHTLTWRRTCEKLLWKIGSLYSVIQKLRPKITVNPYKPPQKSFFPGHGHVFPGKKKCGVGNLSARNSARPWRLVVPRRVAYQHFRIAS